MGPLPQDDATSVKAKTPADLAEKPRVGGADGGLEEGRGMGKEMEGGRELEANLAEEPGRWSFEMTLNRRRE